jgi:hypothetical protein
MPVSSETVTFAGSGLVFENTYDASVTDGYRAAIITAENYLQAHFSDAVTIHAEFDMEAFDATKFIATNTMTGGTGADTFHAFSGAGTDIVTDFISADGDKVQLDAGTTYTLSQVGADTVVDMGSGDELVLKNVTLSSLPSGWIFTL